MHQLLTYDELRRHMGHDLTVSHAGGRQDPTAVTIECRDCGDEPVLAAFERPEAAAAAARFQKRKTRPVEMIVCRPDETWYLTEVTVPVATPETDIEAKATAALRLRLDAAGENVEHVGLHFFPDLDDLADEDTV